MNRTISFGKIDWYDHGQHDCRVEVELRLEDTDQGAVFAACANVWNPRGTDIVCGGQCFEALVPFIPDPAFQEIVHLWRRYHLNDMHAGTPEQEAEVQRWLDGRRYTTTRPRVSTCARWVCSPSSTTASPTPTAPAGSTSPSPTTIWPGSATSSTPTTARR